MKKSEKVILIVTLALAGLMLGSALLWAGWTNVVNHYQEKALREARELAEVERVNEERREQWKAYWETPEGKAEAARKREAMLKQQKDDVETAKIMNELHWAPWKRVAKAFQEAGFDTLPSTEPKLIRAVVPFDSAGALSNYEIKTLCQMAYNALGDGAVVELKDPAGVVLGKADGWSVRAYK